MLRTGTIEDKLLALHFVASHVTFGLADVIERLVTRDVLGHLQTLTEVASGRMRDQTLSDEDRRNTLYVLEVCFDVITALIEYDEKNVDTFAYDPMIIGIVTNALRSKHPRSVTFVWPVAMAMLTCGVREGVSPYRIVVKELFGDDHRHFEELFTLTNTEMKFRTIDTFRSIINMRSPGDVHRAISADTTVEMFERVVIDDDKSADEYVYLLSMYKDCLMYSESVSEMG